MTQNNQEHIHAALSTEEHKTIQKLMQREPNALELGLFIALWSEHCSYKSSKHLLKGLPTQGQHILQGPGENAGVIDIGDGLAVVMKIESHNHPTALEPFQGAATGVGGIIRDILAMGAEPIALLNSLRFGTLNEKHTQYLCTRAVQGIASYGNCVGVPTVGGEIYFHDSYRENPLVNVMCVGIAKHNKLRKAIARGVGNPVIYAGASTGRDGVQGAAFASKNFQAEATESPTLHDYYQTPRPKQVIQVGDPFTGKLLIEGILELAEQDYVVGIQDMGAAGLASASAEMAARGSSGMRLELSKVPLRDTSMTPYDIMLSESQERMLIVVEKGSEHKALQILTHWGLKAAVIGEVIREESLEIYFQGTQQAHLPVKALTEGAPPQRYTPQKPQHSTTKQSTHALQTGKSYNERLLEYFRSPHGASRHSISEQYDSMVKTNTIFSPIFADAAVLRVKGTQKALALTTDCNSKYCAHDPYIGAQIAVIEAARNLSVVGAKPLALTDGLNFGDPNNNEIAWQIEQSISGIKTAAQHLEIPVVSGNVSLYNQSQNKAITPTPIIGMLGLLENVHKAMNLAFKNDEDLIMLCGELFGFQRFEGGQSPADDYEHRGLVLDLDLEKRVQEACRHLIHEGLIESAHDLSEGGLAVAVAECCIAGNKGARLRFDVGADPYTQLCGEEQSRILISLRPHNLAQTLSLLGAHSVSYLELGVVTSVLQCTINQDINLSLQQIRKALQFPIV